MEQREGSSSDKQAQAPHTPSPIQASASSAFTQPQGLTDAGPRRRTMYFYRRASGSYVKQPDEEYSDADREVANILGGQVPVIPSAGDNVMEATLGAVANLDLDSDAVVSGQDGRYVNPRPEI